MEYILFDDAQAELEAMDPPMMLRFIRHIEKISNMPPRRHLRHGNPHFVEKVTKGARFAYKIDEGTIHVVRCFSTHKEYEQWYRNL